MNENIVPIAIVALIIVMLLNGGFGIIGTYLALAVAFALKALLAVAISFTVVMGFKILKSHYEDKANADENEGILFV